MQRKQPRQRTMGMSVKAIIWHRGRILILQKNDRPGSHPWEFPGGGLEFGEDFAAALRREVREETGLAVEILGPVGLWNFRRHLGRPLTGVMFICRADTEEVTLSFEHLAYRWVRPEELAEYPLHASLRKALAQIRPAQLAQAAKLAQQLVGENK